MRKTLAVVIAIAGTMVVTAVSAQPPSDLLLRDGFELPAFADIGPLSDEFESPATLGDWRRIWRDEHWQADQLAQLDVAVSRPGWFSMLPHTSGWYEDYRGELAYKRVAGDFVVSTCVDARNRAGTGAPGSLSGGPVGSEYSLAGLMVRVPRDEVVCCDPSWWQPGGERYVFLSFGSADQTGSYQFETKSTRAAIPPETHSISELIIGAASPGPVDLRTARIGRYLILLVREAGQTWRVQRRVDRPDLPEALQVGLTVYTDWAIVQTYPYGVHNDAVIAHAYLDPGTPADPDLLAQFDHVRFVRPQLPPELAGLDLTDPAMVSDAQLLAFLGDGL